MPVLSQLPGTGRKSITDSTASWSKSWDRRRPPWTSLTNGTSRRIRIQVRSLPSCWEVEVSFFNRRVCIRSCRWREPGVDGAGDGGPGRGVGGGRRAAQPEDLRAQQPHLRRNSREDEQLGLPQDGGAVPVPDEAAEEDVQALLPQPQVEAALAPPSLRLRTITQSVCSPAEADVPFPSATITSSLRFSETPRSTPMRTVPLPRPRCSRWWKRWSHWRSSWWAATSCRLT